MIIPNLMVADMARSLAFYRDALGLSLVMAISPDRAMLNDTDGRDTAFAILSDGDGNQLMLQTVDSIRSELPMLPLEPVFAGTIYLRGHDPRAAVAKLDPSVIVKAPHVQWYGMLEAYLRDPDGTLVCLAVPDGPPPS